MGITFRDYYHPCFTRDGGVIFDSKNDQYILLSDEETTIIQAALLNPEFNDALSPKLETLIAPSVTGEREPVASQIARGMNDYSWRYLPENPTAYVSGRAKPRLILWVYLIQILIKRRGIVGAVNFITRHRWLFRKWLPILDINAFSDDIMVASRLSPFRFECLEFAIAVRCYALVRSIANTRLYLGIQRFPFVAHAWVEHNEKPIGDDQNLRNRAAVIFQI
ncbi:lasso peptide biosynthesis B2 protein [Ochrobactrum chromiisoli]|uniref:Lasso peptide biosynthesis B2 protein n=1 Tax=Ochrobactrum chromiisoli TaxID=2993941 RepID=A0ABT3QNT9_9HYPH|nr:lasso peptide biosynthesis B2 protein [Ochrobactrum chromiisoli]MCX2697282.1 lasso peptide biosynthesis B2 protein [Ochrobactrum chromiisoli]